MSRNREPGFWTFLGYFLVVVVVIAILGGAAWGIEVLVSKPKGTGDIYKQNNSAQNRISNQQHFETLYGDILSYQLQLKQAKADRDNHPGDSYYATVYTGLYNTCVSAVNQYNQDSAKTLYSDWKTADLPQTVDAVATCGDVDVTATPSK